MSEPIKIGPIKIGIVGVGKIVRDQHLPALAQEPGLSTSIAAASRHGKVDGIPNFPTIEAMLDAVPELDAVSLCMPPQFRYDAARTALEAGKHVFLEKPPGATVSEVEDLKALADAKGVSLFASWHSRYAPAVEAARAFLASTTIKSAADHLEGRRAPLASEPGLDLGSPAASASSIPASTRCRSSPTSCRAHVHHRGRRSNFPENRDAPIARRSPSATPTDLPVTCRPRLAPDRPAELGHPGRDRRRARWCCPAAARSSSIDGELVHDEPEAEYPMLYRRFAEIVRAGMSDVDLAPLQHVADAFMLGKRNVVEAFFD